MKTFNEIVDELFKPACGFEEKHHWVRGNWVPNTKYSTAKEEIQRRYLRSLKTVCPFYHADINEPVIRICKLMLEDPERFTVERVGREHVSSLYSYYIEGFIEEIKDQITQQEFKFNEYSLLSPDCFNAFERRLLFTVVNEWHMYIQGVNKQKKMKLEQTRKQKERDELTELYKEK